METYEQMKQMDGKEHTDTGLFFSPAGREIMNLDLVEAYKAHMTERQFKKFEKQLVPVINVWTWKMGMSRFSGWTLYRENSRYISVETGEEIK